MQKRWIHSFLAMVLVCVLLSGNVAFAAGIPLSEALSQVGKKTGMVEISDDFSRYDYFSNPSYTENDGKFIILYRVGPKKEFTVSKTPFDDEFNGVDLGKAEVYLDLDKMAMIPEEHRASSVDEIGNMIMFETFYMHTGTISSWNAFFEKEATQSGLEAAMRGEDEKVEELPDEKVQNYREYRPVFDGFVLAALYNAQDASSVSFDGEQFSFPELRKNPEAADVSERLYTLASIYNACVSQDEETLLLSAFDLLLSGEFTEEQTDGIMRPLSAEVIDYAALEAAVVEMIWDCAKQLQNLDLLRSSLYEEAIQNQSLSGLYYIVQYCDYNSVGRSDEDLRKTGDYMGSIDRSKLVSISAETMELMETVQWDPEMLSLLLQMMAE